MKVGAKILSPWFISLMLTFLIADASLCTLPSSSSVGTLKFLGQASVKIKTLRGEVIYIDPYAGSDYADSADIILVTHQHSDHNQVSLVKRKTSCVVISNYEALTSTYQSFTLGSIKITAVAAYNNYHAKSDCVGYVVEFDGVKIYHAGDTGLIPEMADLASQHITYALLPIGGTYSMTANEAVRADSMIAPQYAIPIHNMNVSLNSFSAGNRIIMPVGSTIELVPSVTSTETSKLLPSSLQLHQNYPNPFNPTTRIVYRINKNAHVELTIYDALGRKIATLIDKEITAGEHSVDFDASRYCSGVYFYRLSSEGFYSVRKMLLMK
jgi:hypothetical protein